MQLELRVYGGMRRKGEVEDKAEVGGHEDLRKTIEKFTFWGNSKKIKMTNIYCLKLPFLVVKEIEIKVTG